MFLRNYESMAPTQRLNVQEGVTSSSAFKDRFIHLLAVSVILKEGISPLMILQKMQADMTGIERDERMNHSRRYLQFHKCTVYFIYLYFFPSRRLSHPLSASVDDSCVFKSLERTIPLSLAAETKNPSDSKGFKWGRYLLFEDRASLWTRTCGEIQP